MNSETENYRESIWLSWGPYCYSQIFSLFIIPVIPVSQKLTGITYLLGSLSVTVVMFNMNIHRYNDKNLKEIKEEHIISPL